MKYSKHISDNQIFYIYEFKVQKYYSVILISEIKLNYNKGFQIQSPSELDFKKYISNFHAILSLGLVSNELIEKVDADPKEILNRIKNKSHFIYLLEYRMPPVIGFNEEETAKSFFCSKEVFIKYYDKDCQNLCFKFSQLILDNIIEFDNLFIIQLHKGNLEQINKKKPVYNWQQVSSMIPHSGNINYLESCLKYINNQSLQIKEINICFDDDSYKQLSNKRKANQLVKIWQNLPQNVGPYYPRDFIFRLIDTDFLIFQDSDDLPTTDRFEILINEINQNPDAGMIGSHTLEVDELEKKINVQRFPVDVNQALLLKPAFSFFHPTSIIKKEAYNLSGGFTKWRKFGSDAQFTYKASLSMQIYNTDNFLYIKRNRANSLMTANRTHINSHIRQFFLQIWKRDITNIQAGKLNLESSSLNETELEPEIDFTLKRIWI